MKYVLHQFPWKPLRCNKKSIKMANKAGILRKIIQGNRRRRRLLEGALSYAMLRRRTLLKTCLISVLLLASRQNASPIYRRSCRRLPRNIGWWDLVWRTYSEQRFVKTFRVSRRTFCFILSRIQHVLERQTINEQPISPECRLAICLYRLSRGDYFYTISEMVGLGVSTVSTIVNEVSEAIIRKLLDMRCCDKIHDSCSQASSIRNGLCEKLWMEKLRK